MNRQRFEEIWNGLGKDNNGNHPVQTNKEELFELVNIVSQIHTYRIMEIGMLTGGTLKFWEQMIPNKQGGGLLIGLDIYPHVLKYPAWNINGSDRDIRIIIKDSIDPSVIEDVKKILGIDDKNDKNDNDNNDGKLLDFLYIDGCHTIRHVVNDFEKFGQFVKVGGIIGFDDMYNVEGGSARTLFPLMSHGNEWIIQLDGVDSLDGSRNGTIDHVPYSQKTKLYKPLRGKCVLIYKGGAGVGAWLKE